MKFSLRRDTHSLSGRLVLLFVVMAVLFVIALGISLRSSFRANFEDNIRPHMVRYLEYIRDDIGMPPDIDKAKALARELPVEMHILGPELNWSSNRTAPQLDDVFFVYRTSANGVRYALGKSAQRDYLLTESADYTIVFSLQQHQGWSWRKLLPIIAGLIILMLLYHATKRLIAPIHTIRAGVEKIGTGQLDHRLHIKRRDELGQLANSINTMADDIQHMLEAKRQLLLAISHELRSPLTRAKVAVEFIDDEKQRNEVNRDLNEMESLIQELLETERLSSRHHVLHKTAVLLTQLLTEVREGLNGGEAIELQLPKETISMEIDVPRIKLLLKNLLENALRHTPLQAQAPQLRLAQSDNVVEITVRDFGPGIEAQHLPHLTEPFYRVDASRQRHTGGYGLGLYLCRVIAEAHGGSLHIHSTPGEGATVKVHLPLPAPA